jgi:hypothetical protein
MPTSTPQIPPQPEAPEYPISALRLFERLTRRSYFERFKEQAPPFDPGRPPQHWFDTSERGDLDYKYNGFSEGTIRVLAIPAYAARTPNLPGPYSYPEYRVKITPAVEILPDGTVQDISPFRLSTLDQAKEIAHEILADLGDHGHHMIQENPIHKGGLYTIDWRGESRRIWQVVFNGQPLNVGQLLRRKFREGVGAPGHWDTGDDSLPPSELVADTIPRLKWVVEVPNTGEDDHRPEVPIPLRALLPDETIVKVNQFGIEKYMVTREGSQLRRPAGGGLTEEQDRRLIGIENDIKRLLELSLPTRPVPA